MPTQFCNLPFTSIIYWRLHMSCLKIFSFILQVFLWNFWCCTVSNFYHACDISIIYCSGGGFLFVYLSCWVGTYAYSWINIYRGWTNNGSIWNENQLMSRFYSYIAGSLHVSGPQAHLQESSYSCSHNHWFSFCAALFACSVFCARDQSGTETEPMVVWTAVQTLLKMGLWARNM